MDANILIVEDDRVSAKIFEETLKKERYTVHVSLDGKAVEAIILDNSIDIILLDIILPETNGYDILRALQSKDHFRDVPVIMVTGLTSPAEIKKALELGALDFIRKPCEPLELVARVGSALRLKHKQDSLNELAKKDILTGLFNRWYFNRTIEKHAASTEMNSGV